MRRACVRRKGSFEELEEGATLHAAENSRLDFSVWLPIYENKLYTTGRCEYPQGLYKVVSGLKLELVSPMLDQTEQRKEHGSRPKVSLLSTCSTFQVVFAWRATGGRRRALLVAD